MCSMSLFEYARNNIGEKINKYVVHKRDIQSQIVWTGQEWNKCFGRKTNEPRPRTFQRVLRKETPSCSPRSLLGKTSEHGQSINTPFAMETTRRVYKKKRMVMLVLEAVQVSLKEPCYIWTSLFGYKGFCHAKNSLECNGDMSWKLRRRQAKKEQTIGLSRTMSLSSWTFF